MASIVSLIGEDFEAAEYTDIKRELDLIAAALKENDYDAARHHQFVALMMANELSRLHRIDEAIESDNGRVVLSAQACMTLA